MLPLNYEKFSLANLLLVRQIRAKFHKNCGFCGKSTKLGTIIVYDRVNNIGNGAHRDLSHNSDQTRFLFCHPETSMETRLVQNALHNSSINVFKTDANENEMKSNANHTYLTL